MVVQQCFLFLLRGTPALQTNTFPPCGLTKPQGGYIIHLSVVTHGSAHISCLNEVHLMAVSENLKFVLIGAHS